MCPRILKFNVLFYWHAPKLLAGGRGSIKILTMLGLRGHLGSHEPRIMLTPIPDGLLLLALHLVFKLGLHAGRHCMRGTARGGFA
jgi:hypothetical protein